MIYKRKMLNITIALMASVLLTGCRGNDDEDEDVGNWMTGATFDGVSRSSAAAFVIGNKGYVGTGYDGDDYLNDFWEFDFDGGYWVQKANFPGSGRSSASAFSIGNHGYMGIGYDGTDETKDFYRYDPASNAWMPIADFGGNLRRGAVSFSSDTKGYIGCGYDGTNDKKDFWRYNPDSDTWIEIFGFGGNKRRDGITFKINDKVYLGTGKSNGVNLKDFWSFDLGSESWVKLRDISVDSDDSKTDDYAILRSNAAAFALGNFGYVTTGTTNTNTWEYNPLTDYWTRKTTLEGISRQDAIAISNGQRAFVLLGRSGNLYLDDMFEFKPFDTQTDDD
ncbi:MAG: galactose oxidase [Flavobacterium sp. BFFFF1]|uniref:Kelch repeat-containing protein n=1 Tax=Flavobacterium sp. BFFFF1 TaxID=2015557 RepID=UPI000BDCEBDE|nr:kelch repeat-containing protein [Flavobacterium sp. BFFFF1]OYU80718.1 MAG: galactose oxidase [Flavobacterium sp. BFFFF1]